MKILHGISPSVLSVGSNSFIRSGHGNLPLASAMNAIHFIATQALIVKETTKWYAIQMCLLFTYDSMIQIAVTASLIRTVEVSNH